MDETGRKIEIFEPFGGAIELTKRILFQPFDFVKCLVIGFAAFMAGLADGTHVGFPGNFGFGDFKGGAATRNLAAVQEEAMSWLFTGVLAVVIIIVVLIVVLFMWLGSRGRFMFIDCIVRNRGAIAEPWREYRREGNSLFLFSLASTVAFLLALAVLALPLLISFFRTGEFSDFGAWQIVYLVVIASLFMLAWIAWAVLVWFAVPVMYRRRCGALAALGEVVKLMAAHPIPFVLFVLFSAVLVIAGALVSCALTCVTCCIAALPYIGTVILLPLYMFYYAYTLLFLQQFGRDSDAWGGLAAEPASPPTDEPPLLQPPPLPM